MEVKKVILGECDYFGKKATAIREMAGDVWKFVLLVEGERILLNTY